jgi:alkylhydroperoxidase family enzyme
MTEKIPLPDESQLAPEIVATLKRLPALNVFRMMANAPASFQPLINFAMSILLSSEFDKRKREIAVLRVAHVTRSIYEWTQHVAVAKSVGVTDDEIARIAVDGPVTQLDEEGNLLCRVADEVSRDVRLSGRSAWRNQAALRRTPGDGTHPLLRLLQHAEQISGIDARRTGDGHPARQGHTAAIVRDTPLVEPARAESVSTVPTLSTQCR